MEGKHKPTWCANDSYYFALTESQYNEIRNIIAEGKGKIKKIKSDIQGEPYVGPNSIKHCLKVDIR